MNQKITQKQPNPLKSQKIQEIATNLLKQRACLLINNADYAVHKQIQCQEMWTAYQTIIDTFKDQPIRTQLFRLHVLAGGTRSWEGLALNDNKERRFQIGQSRLSVRINQEFLTNHQIMSEQVNIEKILNNHPLIVAAKNNLLRNLEIVGKIIVHQNFPQIIEQFFTSTKFYSYSFPQIQIQKTQGSNNDHLDSELIQQEEPQEQVEMNQDQQILGDPNNLQGLSSYNGQKTYINKILLDNAEKQLHLLKNLQPLGQNNREYDKLSDISKALVTLEHEGLHGLIRFVMNNENPQLISPEKNYELRIEGQMQEAGNYYAFKAYGIIAEVSPFCLNVQQLK